MTKWKRGVRENSIHELLVRGEGGVFTLPAL